MFASKLSAARLLAVDIRVGRLSYAAFEAPGKLLSFGVSRIDTPEKTRERISKLIKRFRPSTIVLRRLTSHSKRDRLHHALIARIIRKEARSFSIPVDYVPESALNAFFRQIGKRNKYDIAVLLAVWFPDLTWKVPPRRKVYKPEPWTITLFDAVAVGAAYLASQNLLKVSDLTE